jgi:hypothetical protein
LSYTRLVGSVEKLKAEGAAEGRGLPGAAAAMAVTVAGLVATVSWREEDWPRLVAALEGLLLELAAVASEEVES